MSYKSNISAKYDAATYKITTELQQNKQNEAKLKNQLVFLERCIHHKIIPKSLRIRSPLNTKGTQGIIDSYRFKLLICLKNDVKRRYFSIRKKITVVTNTLVEKLSPEDMNNVKYITDKSRETAFQKSRLRLMNKFTNLQSPQKRTGQKSNTNHVKNTVLNLCDTDLPQHHQDLLNLGPKFVPTNKRIPYMDIISTTESSALKLEYDKKIETAQTLRMNVLRALKMAKPPKDNLTLQQKIALKELRGNDTPKIYPFDKGTGFVRIESENALRKIEEQIGNAKLLDYDPTASIATSIRTELSKLNKNNKFTKIEYQQIYPSDPIPPRMYGQIKAHKPEKDYPMRVVVSTIGTPTYGLSKYLVNLSQPLLDKNPTRLKNSTEFVLEASKYDIAPNEIQVSYDVINLYPKVPLKEAINVFLDLLSSDTELKSRTKLTIIEIKRLVELCLNRCYFLWNGSIYELQNSGPIGLSLMVVMAESFLQHIEAKAINTLRLIVPPVPLKSFKRYVDDSHARFNTHEHADIFLTVLNNQHPAIQYTIEREDPNKQINFLDVTVRNTGNGKYDFSIHRKPAITNVQIKPSSCHDPNILEGVFKGFVHRALKICSEKHLKNELDFLIEVFVENGYDINKLQNIVKQISNKSTQMNSSNHTTESPADTLQTITLPWIPGLSPKLRKIYRNAGYKVAFKSGANLNTLLTSVNKTALPPNSQPGVYIHQSTCNKKYVGQTKLQVRTRTAQHQNNIIKKRWDEPIANHLNQCECKIEWDKSKILKVETNRFNREVREALEIQHHKSGPKNGGMNLDDGKYVKTTFWSPFMKYLTNIQNQQKPGPLSV